MQTMNHQNPTIASPTADLRGRYKINNAIQSSTIGRQYKLIDLKDATSSI